MWLCFSYLNFTVTHCFNPFHVIGLFLYSLENVVFSLKYVNNIRKKRLINLIYYMLSFFSCLQEQCINIRLCSLTHFNPVSRFIETYHLFCRLKQMTGFYIKLIIGLKWVKMMVLSVMRNRNIRDGKRKTIEESIF